VDRIPDDGLIEITNLYVDVTVGIGEGAQVSQMAIAADPHRWPCGQLTV
jgi:hypothetical protein